MDPLLKSAAQARSSAAAVGPLDALRQIVVRAEGREPGVPLRMDPAVTRWSRAVPSPADVLALVATVRFETKSCARRDEILQRVERVGVAAVADRQVRAALTDPLTGLATRARLEDEAQHLMAVSTRGSRPLTAVVLDVDGLKQINDVQGHAAGDAAIAEVGRAVRAHIRRTDRAFRWGGDEFVILMPDTTSEGARVVLERLQRSCATATSAGLDTYDAAVDQDVAGWLARADAELYRSRRDRRGTTSSHAHGASRPSRLHAGRRTVELALVGLAAISASTAGWFTATEAAHRLNPAAGDVQARVLQLGTDDTGPSAATRFGGSMQRGPEAQRPTSTVVVPAPGPMSVIAAAEPVRLPTVIDDVVTPVLETRLPAVPVPVPTQVEEADPSLVGGVVQTVKDLVGVLL